MGIPIANNSALILSVAFLVAKEYFSKLEKRDTTLGNWVNVKNLLYEKQ